MPAPASRLSHVAGLARAQRGLLAVIALFLCFGALNVLGVPPLLPIDERAHLGYALALADGELPTIDTPLSSADFPPADRDYRNTVWVANHPPLYYALVAPLARLGMALGGVDSAIALVRWLSLLLGAAALLFVHATALLLTDGDRKVALLTTLIAALIPHTLHISALVHNDSLAILMAAAALYSGLLIAVRGYSHARAAGLAATAALAMLTRFTSVAVVVPACGIACVGLLLRDEEPMPQRLRRSLATGGIAVAATLITSGWFYLRNLRLYDDVTGGAALFEKVGRSARNSALRHALERRLWKQIYQDLWTRFSGGVRLDGMISEVAWLILLAALIGLGVRGYACWRQRSIRLVSTASLAVAGLAAAVALILAAMFEFYSRGGSLHARYMLPVLWVLALAMAWGLSALGATVARVVAVLLCLVDLLVFGTYLAGLVEDPSGDQVALVEALQQAGVGGASWVVAGIVVVIALSLHTVVAAVGGPTDSRKLRASE